MIAASCRANINGSPMRNLACFVLCLKTNIPAKAPALPPANATAKSLASGIRSLPCTARSLSMPNMDNANMFIATR